jgi:hypothetical protein
VYALAKLTACISKEDASLLQQDADVVDAEMRKIWGSITVGSVIGGLSPTLQEAYGAMTVYDAGLGEFIKTALSPDPLKRTITMQMFLEVRFISGVLGPD